MNLNLEQVLHNSAEFHAEIDALWRSFSPASTQRGYVVSGFCSIVREHVLSQQHLLAIGHDVTAMTLVRPPFESLVRAIWSLQGASDEWIQLFLTPPLPGADERDEAIRGPSVSLWSLWSTEATRPSRLFSLLATAYCGT